ncbi:transcriptional regulator [Clostridia bacterium]|nr:transcriptional regulator [Clostridia bacterium]
MTEIICQDELCDCELVHEDVICRVGKGLSSDDTLHNTAELFKVLSDPTRLKIINALLLSEMCVCDIAELMNMTQPAVSHHLKMLRQMHIVKTQREGKSIFYSIKDEHVSNMFYQGLLHAEE